MNKENTFKERLNYVVTDNCVVGATVNLPLVCQADNIEDLKRKMKIMGQLYIKHIAENFEMDEPFEIKELSEKEWMSKDRETW